jgi:hypothetical protein
MKLTYTTTEYSEFIASDHKVFFNSDLDRVAITCVPTNTELTKVICQYEQSVLSYFWDEVVLQEHQLGGFIIALGNTDSNSSSYFSARALSKLNKNLRFRKKSKIAILSELRNLPIAEQRDIVNEYIKRPKTFAESLSLFTSRAHHQFAFDFHSEFKKAGSFQQFIELLMSNLNKRAGSKQQSATGCRIDEMLVLLHQRRWILLPLMPLNAKLLLWTFHPAISNPKLLDTFTRCDFLIAEEVKTFFAYILRDIYETNNIRILNIGGNKFAAWALSLRRMLRQFFLCTNVNSLSDIVPELLEAFYATQRKTHERLQAQGGTSAHITLSAVSSVCKGLGTLWKVNNPDSTYIQATDDNDLERHFTEILERRPDLQAWVEFFCEYINGRHVENVSYVVFNLRPLLIHISELTHRPASPLEATREHVRDFVGYLARLELTNETRNSYLREASFFFNWCKRTYKSPVDNPIEYKLDRFSEGRERQSKTHRIALRPRVIFLMREVLTKDNFAWAKTLDEDYITAFDRHEGVKVRVWFPGRAVLIDTMLTFPTRTIGARLLDSGEADEKIYDPELRQMVVNPDPRAIPGRRAGVLRLKTGLSGTILSLRIPEQKLHSAYDIDYIPSDQADHLQMMIDWQKRYGTPFELVKLADDPKAIYKNRDFKVKSKQADIVPLFRDPVRRLGHQQFPITDGRLQRIFRSLCVETERQHPDIVLTKELGSGKRKTRVPVFDKHTLRVSLTTGLIHQGGLPLTYARQMLNHASLVMTLHYDNPDIQQVHEALRSAYSKMEESGLDAEKFAAEYDKNRRRFISNSEHADAAFRNNRNNKGLWTVGLTGVCPGTSCDEGGPVINSSRGVYAPVPGARCALCRFFLTGPTFLLGLTVEANNLMWHIKNKAKKLQALFDKRIELEASRDKRGLTQIDNSIDRLDEEVDIDWQEWQALARLIGSSNAMMEEESSNYQGSKEEKQKLMMKGSLSELRVAMSECSYFELLHSITESAEVLPNFPKAQNDGAIMEKHELLNTLLVINDLDPFLIKMPERLKLRAGNLLSAMLIKHAPESHVDDLVLGNILLRDSPGLEADIADLQHQLLAIPSTRKALFAEEEHENF